MASFLVGDSEHCPKLGLGVRVAVTLGAFASVATECCCGACDADPVGTVERVAKDDVVDEVVADEDEEENGGGDFDSGCDVDAEA